MFQRQAEASNHPIAIAAKEKRLAKAALANACVERGFLASLPAASMANPNPFDTISTNGVTHTMFTNAKVAERGSRPDSFIRSSKMSPTAAMKAAVEQGKVHSISNIHRILEKQRSRGGGPKQTVASTSLLGRAWQQNNDRSPPTRGNGNHKISTSDVSALSSLCSYNSYFNDYDKNCKDEERRDEELRQRTGGCNGSIYTAVLSALFYSGSTGVGGLGGCNAMTGEGGGVAAAMDEVVAAPPAAPPAATPAASNPEVEVAMRVAVWRRMQMNKLEDVCNGVRTVRESLVDHTHKIKELITNGKPNHQEITKDIRLAGQKVHTALLNILNKNLNMQLALDDISSVPNTDNQPSCPSIKARRTAMQKEVIKQLEVVDKLRKFTEICWTTLEKFGKKDSMYAMLNEKQVSVMLNELPWPETNVSLPEIPIVICPPIPLPGDHAKKKEEEEVEVEGEGAMAMAMEAMEGAAAEEDTDLEDGKDEDYDMFAKSLQELDDAKARFWKEDTYHDETKHITETIPGRPPVSVKKIIRVKDTKDDYKMSLKKITERRLLLFCNTNKALGYLNAQDKEVNDLLQPLLHKGQLGQFICDETGIRRHSNKTIRNYEKEVLHYASTRHARLVVELRKEIKEYKKEMAAINVLIETSNSTMGGTGGGIDGDTISGGDTGGITGSTTGGGTVPPPIVLFAATGGGTVMLAAVTNKPDDGVTNKDTSAESTINSVSIGSIYHNPERKFKIEK